MSTLKRKSNITLIAAILFLLLLMPVWYVVIAPLMVTSELEKIDLQTKYVGTFGKKGYIGTASIINRSAVWEIPVNITAHVHAEAVDGAEVTLGIDVSMIRNDNGEKLPSPFSRNSTYVFNKFTLENVKDSPEADKPREGYDPLYPSHIKSGENIHKAWLDNLNTTATLEFEESVKEEDMLLYKYFVNETLTELLWIEDLKIFRNSTLTSTKTILVEPLSGLHVYTENETFNWIITYEDTELPLIYITYKSTPEAKADGIATAKQAHDALQLLELYIPTILGAIVIVLAIVFIFNTRRLKGKKPRG